MSSMTTGCILPCAVMHFHTITLPPSMQQSLTTSASRKSSPWFRYTLVWQPILSRWNLNCSVNKYFAQYWQINQIKVEWRWIWAVKWSLRETGQIAGGPGQILARFGWLHTVVGLIGRDLGMDQTLKVEAWNISLRCTWLGPFFIRRGFTCEHLSCAWSSRSLSGWNLAQNEWIVYQWTPKGLATRTSSRAAWG